MKTDLSQLPTEIFDWIENYPFAILNTEQQKFVLEHMSNKEYSDLFDSFQLLKGSVEQNIEIDFKQKQLEINKYWDKHHQELIPLHSTKRLSIWKAAAVFFFLSTAALLYATLTKSNHPLAMTHMNKDTVYLKSAPVTIIQKVYDTIRLKNSPTQVVNASIQQRISKSMNPSKKVKLAMASHKLNKQVPILENELHISSLKEWGSPQNLPKGSNMKDDSLESNYMFVRL